MMTKLLRSGAAALLTAALCCGPVGAQPIKAGDLQIEQAWSRATPAGAKIGAGYLTIANKGTVADRLIGGSTPAAGKLEIHQMSIKDNVMTMRPVTGGLPIEPGKTVTLAPSGYHLMFVGLKAPLKQGTRLTATLEFEKAGNVEVPFDVQGVGAASPHSGH